MYPTISERRIERCEAKGQHAGGEWIIRNYYGEGERSMCSASPHYASRSAAEAALAACRAMAAHA